MTPQEFKSAAHFKFLRFVLIGFMNTILHFIVVVIFIKKVLPEPVFANTLAFTIATIFSYIINTNWSFSNSISMRSLIRFLLVSIVGLCLTIAISSMAKNHGINYVLSTFLVVFFVPPVIFFLHFFWTYR